MIQSLRDEIENLASKFGFSLSFVYGNSVIHLVSKDLNLTIKFYAKFYTSTDEELLLKLKEALVFIKLSEIPKNEKVVNRNHYSMRIYNRFLLHRYTYSQ